MKSKMILVPWNNLNFDRLTTHKTIMIGSRSNPMKWVRTVSDKRMVDLMGNDLTVNCSWMEPKAKKNKGMAAPLDNKPTKSVDSKLPPKADK